jgi:hypothetical protein
LLRRNRLAIAGSVAMVVAIAASLLLLAMATRLYPGGSAINPHAKGHSLWLNFLCDLTNETAVNGVANGPAAHLARAAMISLAIAVACFWSVLPASFADRRPFPVAIRAFGLLSVAVLLTVPQATGRLHMVAVLLSSVSALCAGALGLTATVRWSRSPTLVVLACAAVAAALVDSILYARSYLIHPRVVTAPLPFFQRVALILTLAWMAGVALRVLANAPWRETASGTRSTTR